MAPQEYLLTVSENGVTIAPKVELADSPWKRMRGLLGRTDLVPGGGMRFEPASSLHMLFMRFPIDVIYVDRDERVVKLVRNFKPWRFSWAWGARTAYELAAGSINRSGVAVGDVLELRPNEHAAVA